MKNYGNIFKIVDIIGCSEQTVPTSLSDKISQLLT